ncbi:hypothetical protein CORC01_12903 [Colletotrichum orchidophilum]|uniref:Uncharacterized protein n=1 Tax=Colletotrichum orchidophilum TaxID=1209926 RepID=A0A1G4ARP1_9PEZI|nr:uncharacterized protein CORC01_12903 [Colletotrichum orchidophilum]OHE91776.1 hypothetical protein CORC01_12903 [Colletotrichum orchidophilum]
MSSRRAPKRKALFGLSDLHTSHSHPHPQQEDDKLANETSKILKTLTESTSHTQCVFSDEDVIPDSTLVGVSGRLGDTKLASMQKMVTDSIPEGTQVKIIYVISKIDNGPQAKDYDDPIFIENYIIKESIRGQIRQHEQNQAEEDDEEDFPPQPKKLRRGTASSVPEPPVNMKSKEGI